ncbi:MAG: hypothetical protein NT158_09720 [Cyanobacteria bacterium]|nr:hypothetical protein [Cyanobacteriota bacterium]
MPLPVLAATPAPAAAPAPASVPGPRLLYRLATNCAVAGSPPVNCTVEAVDEGISTLYRHTIGKIRQAGLMPPATTTPVPW